MRKTILILLLIASLILNAQDNEPWIAYWDSDMTHIGKIPRDHEMILGFLHTHRLDQRFSSKINRLNHGTIFFISLLFLSASLPNLYDTKINYL